MNDTSVILPLATACLSLERAGYGLVNATAWS